MRPRTHGHSTLLRLIQQSGYRMLAIIVAVAFLPWAQMEAVSSRAAGRPGPTIRKRASAVQASQEITALLPGKPVEREIAGGQEHAYRIALQAGQFVRFVVEQKGIDVAVALAAPDGKQVSAVNLIRAGGVESLSVVAEAGGDYHLAIRAAGASKTRGAYLLRVEMREPSAQDRQRIAAEALAVKAGGLSQQGQDAAPQAIEKWEQALAAWRELNDKPMIAMSLISIGGRYRVLARYDKAIEYGEQALSVAREAKDQNNEEQALNLLAYIYFALNRYEKVIEYGEQVLPTVRERKDRPVEANILIGIGSSNYNLGRYQKALEYLEPALAIAREIKDKTLEASALLNLSLVYQG
ncbi:MAG: tetratricopeptide repeat protein, partial [Acidobacteria bacterium]|nr:tetratricopeptide repeat protein [Acidobacteriota bacterium]